MYTGCLHIKYVYPFNLTEDLVHSLIIGSTTTLNYTKNKGIAWNFTDVAHELVGSYICNIVRSVPFLNPL